VEARRIFELLTREEALSAEEIARSIDLPAAAVLAALFELEGAGLAMSEAGRYGVSRR
jgi:predicted transcriptional regulator